MGTKMIPIQLIEAVEIEHQAISSKPYQWSEIEISHGDVYLHIGRLRPDGSKEVKLLTKKYYLDSNGDVRFVNIGGDGSGL